MAALCILFPPGRADHPQTPRLHRPHPRTGRAPHVPAAGQRAHPDVALPTVPPLSAQRSPSGAHVRGLPHPLLLQVGLQGARALRHHRGSFDLYRDVVPHQRTRLHAAQQRGNPVPAASADAAGDNQRRPGGCITIIGQS